MLYETANCKVHSPLAGLVDSVENLYRLYFLPLYSTAILNLSDFEIKASKSILDKPELSYMSGFVFFNEINTWTPHVIVSRAVLLSPNPLLNIPVFLSYKSLYKNWDKLVILFLTVASEGFSLYFKL
ncbi:hypothetical protein MASR1M68_08390 [Elusimicrobiota bacterium]